MYAPREADLFTRLQAFAPLPEYLADGKAHVLHIDFEGRCQLHLDVVGNDNWSQHAEALCLAYGVDDGEVLIWRPGDPVPACFIEAARNPLWLVVSFNAGFERSIFSHLLVPQYEFPGIPVAQWRCTQAALRARRQRSWESG